MAGKKLGLPSESDRPLSGFSFFLRGPVFSAFLILLIGGVLLFSYEMLEPVLTMYAGAPSVAAREVSLSEPTVPETDKPDPNATGEKFLRVAVAPLLSPRRTMELYGPLTEFLARRVGRTPMLLQRHCYGDINELLRWGQCDVAVVGTYALVQGERDFGMEILAVPEAGGIGGHCSYIIAPQSSTASSLLDLRGKRFAFVDFLSDTGWLFPATWLIEHAEDPRNFFREQVITEAHDTSIRAVAKGFVDAAAVDSVIYDRMLKEHNWTERDTKVITVSPAFGLPPLVVHPALDPILRQMLGEALFEMGGDEDGRKALSLLGVDRFVPGNPSAYDDVRRQADKVEKY
ncbi:MAG: PhnD/SsuA/transferrin family substrate-binding protein [Candidatus Hydrogenedentes bacterium]|nr:PhnD/SsuA/transferrin family substrate-binding protein [Candidatus Hydrogenedentota bacterium]